MAALPYMQLYVADYLADTAHLTTEEHGAYLLMLFSYWQTGKPLRADRLASVSRLSNERWTDAERTLKDFFHVSNGTWTHFRVEADLEKVGSKSKKNSESGKASARARALAKQQLEDAIAASVPTNVATNAERTYQRNVNHTRSGDTDTDTEQDQKPLSLDAPLEGELLSDQREKPRTPGKPRFSYSDIQQAYNDICPPTFPACAVMSDKRKRQIKQMAEIVFMDSKPFTKGIEVWRQYFTDCLTNTHWCGQNDRNWRADFDFVTTPKNAIKLMELMN